MRLIPLQQQSLALFMFKTQITGIGYLLLFGWCDFKNTSVQKPADRLRLTRAELNLLKTAE